MLVGKERLLGGLRALDSVFGTAAATLLDAGGIEGSAHNVIAHAGEILHASAADENDGVLLKIVALVRDIGDDFATVGQADLGDFADGGIRLLRGAGHDLHANAATKRIAVQGR